MALTIDFNLNLPESDASADSPPHLSHEEFVVLVEDAPDQGNAERVIEQQLRARPSEEIFVLRD